MHLTGMPAQDWAPWPLAPEITDGGRIKVFLSLDAQTQLMWVTLSLLCLGLEGKAICKRCWPRAPPPHRQPDSALFDTGLTL